MSASQSGSAPAGSPGRVPARAGSPVRRTSRTAVNVQAVSRVRIATWIAVAAFQAGRSAPVSTAIHSVPSVRLTPARITRQPRSRSRIRAAGSGSLRRHSRTRGAQQAAMSGTKNIMKDTTVSNGSFSHGA